MKKLLSIFTSLLLGVGILSVRILPSYAQIDTEEDTAVSEIEMDWDDAWDISDIEIDSPYSFSTDIDDDKFEDFLENILGGTALVFGGVMLAIALGISLAMYIYFAIALMSIAKRLGHSNGWFAWIPILNAILLFQMGEKSPWLLLLAFIPGVGALILTVLNILAVMTICEKRGYDKLLALLMLIPFANLVLMGILAWGKKS